MAHTIQFVDAIDAGANVLLDINADEFRCIRFVPNPPGLRRSVSSNLMRDGAHFGPSSYDSRTIDVTIELVAGNADDWAASFQVLARLLDQETAILRYQREGATHPVFFKTHRTDISEILEVTSYRVRDQVSFTMPADSHALGLQEAFAGSFSFAASGMYATCPTIKGDVSAPLRMVFDIPAADFYSNFMLSSVAGSGTVPVVRSTNGELSGTPAPGLTSLQTGLGGNYFNGDAIRTVSLSTTPTKYLSEIPTTLTPGRWRVMGRFLSTGSGYYYARIDPYAGSAAPPDRPGSRFGPGTYGIVDLGVHSVPVGNPGRPGGGWAAVAVEWQLWLWKSASATGQLDIDALIFVPVEVEGDVLSRSGFVAGSANIASGTRVLDVDGETRTVSAYAGTTLPDMSETVSSSWPQLFGDFPEVSPGQTNTLYMVPQDWYVTTPAVPDITDTVDFAAAYYPRYTTIRPVAT